MPSRYFRDLAPLLSADDKRRLAFEFWEGTIPANELDPDDLIRQMAEMERRAEELEAHPERGISHEELKKRLRSLKFRKRR